MCSEEYFNLCCINIFSVAVLSVAGCDQLCWRPAGALPYTGPVGPGDPWSTGQWSCSWVRFHHPWCDHTSWRRLGHSPIQQGIRFVLYPGLSLLSLVLWKLGTCENKCIFTFCFRGSPREESGGHLPVGAEAFPAETPNQPGEYASLTLRRYTGSPAAEGLCLNLIWHMTDIIQQSGWKLLEFWQSCLSSVHFFFLS